MTSRLASSALTLALAPVLGLAATLALPAGLTGQSAQEVLESAAERYAERMEGIENYTVVQNVMGFETTVYYERTEVDGHPVFVAREVMGVETAEQTPDNPANLYRTLAENATHEGTEDVGGESCHVIAIDDFSGIDMAAFGAEGEAGQGEWTPESMRLWLDEDQLVPRKMVMNGTVSTNGSESPVTMTTFMEDYREVEGMLHPFRMHMESEGMAEAAGMSESEMAEMREGMEQMQRQMEQMPESQRKMMEQMMGGQLDQMKKMVSSGSMEVTVEVQDVRVNQGPPSGG